MQNDSSIPATVSPYPSHYTDLDLTFELVNHANVFSRERLDHGARFLMQQYDQIPISEHVVDLGCGNGVLGIRLQQMQAEARLTFIDESCQAIASAKASFQACFNDQYVDSGAPKFLVSDGLDQVDDNASDLILCNPPFHQQHVLGEQVAVSMFADMKRCLRTGGQAWIVANRHLDYAGKLKRLFGNCRTVDSNRKFTVLKIFKR